MHMFIQTLKTYQTNQQNDHRRPVISRSLSGWAGSHQHWYSAREQFYAIYYTTEFKFIGRGDAFIAPTNGTYTFKLWGSPDGYNNGLGAYTDVNVYLKRNQKIYAYVGSAGGVTEGDNTAGGYNGGGWALVCLAGPHACTGGGATHISWSNNPIITDKIVKSRDTATARYLAGDTRGSAVTKIGNQWSVVHMHRWDNINDVIAVAGGAGGRNHAGTSYAGSSVITYHDGGSVRKVVPGANNAGTGYTHGAGQYCANSCGAGGGWYGGYSMMYCYPNMIQTHGGNCGNQAGGGTSYIKPGYSGSMIGNGDARLYNGSQYTKPWTEGTNGYIVVRKQ